MCQPLRSDCVTVTYTYAGPVSDLLGWMSVRGSIGCGVVCTCVQCLLLLAWRDQVKGLDCLLEMSSYCVRHIMYLPYELVFFGFGVSFSEPQTDKLNSYYVCIHVYIYAVCLFDPVNSKVAADHGRLKDLLRKASDERLIK